LGPDAAQTVRLSSPALPVRDDEFDQQIIVNLHDYEISVKVEVFRPDGTVNSELPCPTLAPGATCGHQTSGSSNPGPRALYMRVTVTETPQSFGFGIFKNRVRATLCNLTRNICVEAR
jgi:hypothetical protein